LAAVGFGFVVEKVLEERTLQLTHFGISLVGQLRRRKAILSPGLGRKRRTAHLHQEQQRCGVALRNRCQRS